MQASMANLADRIVRRYLFARVIESSRKSEFLEGIEELPEKVQIEARSHLPSVPSKYYGVARNFMVRHPDRPVSEVFDAIQQFEKYGHRLTPERRKEFLKGAGNFKRHQWSLLGAEYNNSEGGSDHETVYEDDKVKVVIPLSHKSMRGQGLNAKWCIATATPAYARNYRNAGNLHAFVIDKTVPEGGPDKRHAITFKEGGKKVDVRDQKDAQGPGHGENLKDAVDAVMDEIQQGEAADNIHAAIKKHEGALRERVKPYQESEGAMKARAKRITLNRIDYSDPDSLNQELLMAGLHHDLEVEDLDALAEKVKKEKGEGEGDYTRDFDWAASLITLLGRAGSMPGDTAAKFRRKTAIVDPAMHEVMLESATKYGAYLDPVEVFQKTGRKEHAERLQGQIDQGFGDLATSRLSVKGMSENSLEHFLLDALLDSKDQDQTHNIRKVHEFPFIKSGQIADVFEAVRKYDPHHDLVDGSEVLRDIMLDPQPMTNKKDRREMNRALSHLARTEGVSAARDLLSLSGQRNKKFGVSPGLLSDLFHQAIEEIPHDTPTHTKSARDFLEGNKDALKAARALGAENSAKFVRQVQKGLARAGVTPESLDEADAKHKTKDSNLRNWIREKWLNEDPFPKDLRKDMGLTDESRNKEYDKIKDKKCGDSLWGGINEDDYLKYRWHHHG